LTSGALELRHPKPKTWNRFVNFTREPIIETIISPKEGYKLLVRSSKSGGPAEDYFVDAVEVVSFGHAFFFRSTERPKAFLVPASDYEVLEVKETRVALKSASHDRNIKIGGGREASMRHQQREPSPEREPAEPMVAEEQPAQTEETGLEAAIGARMDKRRDRRRRRHRRSDDDWTERRAAEPQQQQPQAEGEPKGQAGEEETKVSSPMFSSLIPPPPNLISQTLSRYKDKEFVEGVPPEKEVEKEKKQAKEPPEEASGSEPLHRIAAAPPYETLKLSSFTSTQFSPPSDGDSFFF
jgi:hypothetical protein